MPPFVLRAFWDNWLVWKALDEGEPVIDASRAVMACTRIMTIATIRKGKPASGAEQKRGSMLSLPEDGGTCAPSPTPQKCFRPKS
jgi:hypothetical protein